MSPTKHSVPVHDLYGPFLLAASGLIIVVLAAGRRARGIDASAAARPTGPIADIA